MTPLLRTCHTCGATIDTHRSGGFCPACLLGDALDADDLPTLGAFGGHELIVEIARGGMGVVYRARQSEPQREVALKTLLAAGLHTPDAAARFRHEARAMAELEHPAILPIHQFGEQDGIPYFTMKLATGGSLAARIGDFAGQWSRIAELIATLAEAVHFAHERGVLHRDLKPANILFDGDGRAYVSDFGLAKIISGTDMQLTVATAMLGTPHYLAPEIAGGDARAATIASDIWSLGVILYEMLAQARPFSADCATAVLRQIAEREPPAIANGAPRDLEVIARHAMTKERGGRYATARALSEDLCRWREGRPILARRPSPIRRLTLWARRSPALAALSVTTALLVILGVAGLGWGFQRVRHERDATQEELRNSLLHQARGSRSARFAGWRDAGLEALRRAAAIRFGLDLRHEAIAHLAGFDLKDSTGIVLPASTAAARDFKSYVSFDPDAILRLHDIPDGRSVGDFPAAPQFGGLRPQFDPTGRWIAAESSPGDVHLFDIAKRHLSKSWRGSRFGGFGAGGEWFGIDDPGKPTRVIRTEDQEEIAVLPNEAVSTSPSASAPDPRSTAIAIGRPEAVEIWDWETQRRLERLPTLQTPGALAWHGDWLAAGTRRGEIALFNLRERRSEILAEHSNRVSAFAFSHDGVLLASSSYDGTAVLWHTDTGQLLLRSREIYPRAFSPDGIRLLYGRADGHGWAELQRPTVVRYFSDRIIGRGEANLDVSPDGRWLVVCGNRGVAIFELRSGRLLATRELKGSRTAHFTADGHRLVVSGGSLISLFVLAVENAQLEIQMERDLSPAGARDLEMTLLSPDRRWLGVASNRSRAGVLDCEDFSTWTWLPTAARPIMVSPASGGRWVAGGAFNNVDGLRVWDREQPANSRRLTVGNAQPSFSPDGRWLADGGTQQTRIYETGTWQLVHAEPSNSSTDLANHLAWSADSRLLALVKYRNLVCLFETSTWQLIAELNNPLQHPVASLRFAPDGRTLVVSRSTGGLEVWNLTELAVQLSALGLPWELPPASPAAVIPSPLAGELKTAELPPLFPSNAR